MRGISLAFVALLAACFSKPANTTGGNGDGTSSSTPTAVFPGRKCRAIAGGAEHTCGIGFSDGKVHCWGENQYGQVGDGSSYEPSPVVAGVP